jgi:excisionase family DNA binding protein
LQNGSESWAPEYTSVGFVAKRCGVSNTTVLRWISAGQLPAFRLPGGHYRIERSDLSDFLARYHMPVINSPTANQPSPVRKYGERPGDIT